MNVANNHTLDFGRIAFLDTLRIARQNGIATVGGGADLAAARRPVIVERGGMRIAFLAYSDVRPEGFTAARSLVGTAPADVAAIRADVLSARRRADVVLVWMHWGEELARTANDRQRLFASAALNAGAQVVLGSHSHLLQAIVRPTRRALVAWSLGNFVFPPSSPGTDRTAIFISTWRGTECGRIDCSRCESLAYSRASPTEPRNTTERSTRPGSTRRPRRLSPERLLLGRIRRRTPR